MMANAIGSDYTSSGKRKSEGQPWWLSLPDSFGQSAFLTDKDSDHKLKVMGSAALDSVVRTGLASSVLAAMAPHMLSPERVQRDIRNLSFYSACADRRNVEEVFPRPPEGIKVTRERIPNSRFLPQNTHAELLRFDSPYQVLNPELRNYFDRKHHGIPAVAQHWRHPGGPRPTLIFTHGFGADAFWLNSLSFSLGWLFKQGYDILLHTLPFHGARMRRSDLLSGMGFFSHGFSHMNEAFLQGVFDLRVWMDYLEEQGVTAIGASGYSLGGYTTALAASCDNRLKFAIPNAPMVLPIDMILGWQPLGWAIRHMMKTNDLSLADLRHMTAVHCPLTWKPVLPAERLMVIGGAGDRFTSPQFVNILHEHWAGSAMHWFPGNHLVHLHQPDYLRLMKQFMDKACADTAA